MPSVSGPAVISLTFLPAAISTTATLAGVLSSSSSSSSLWACFEGGLPFEEGSVETKTCPS